MALLARNRRALATQGQIGNQGLAMDSKLVRARNAGASAI